MSVFKSLVAVSPFVLFSCGGGSGGGSDAVADQVLNDIADPAFNLPAPDLSGVSSVSGVATGVVSAEVVARVTTEITQGINDARVDRGLTALTYDENLADIALDHCEYLASQAPENAVPIQISHDNFETRAEQVFTNGYIFVGENVAGQRSYPEDQITSIFVDGWLNSPGHLENIETAGFTHTGVGVLVDERDGTIYATQIFGESP